MAKSAAYRWQNERKHGLVGKPSGKPRKRTLAKITNKQAKYLASLQRELHVPYTGASMTKREATVAIHGCLVKLGRKTETPPKRGHTNEAENEGGA